VEVSNRFLALSEYRPAQGGGAANAHVQAGGRGARSSNRFRSTLLFSRNSVGRPERQAAIQTCHNSPVLNGPLKGTVFASALQKNGAAKLGPNHPPTAGPRGPIRRKRWFWACKRRAGREGTLTARQGYAGTVLQRKIAILQSPTRPKDNTLVQLECR